MPMEQEEFKFPDEKEQESKGKPVEAKDDEAFEIEVEDDTPPEDKGRQPMPANLKEELENDELDQYDERVKTKLKQMKKVWHDERREKERVVRENTEAVSMLQRLMDENKKYRELIQTGSKEYATTLENAANLELEMAKKAYREAYESGDADQIVEAQQALQHANIRILQAKNFRPPALQEQEIRVQPPNYEQDNANTPDRSRFAAWQKRNDWYGKDEEMTAAALGWHEKTLRQGDVVIGSEAYYRMLDKTMRKRFPEQFEDSQPVEESASDSDQNDEEEPVVKKVKTETAPTKPSTVVAPATRSTASKKIRLKQSTLDMIKKLGVTPEQYVREQYKLESKNV